MNLFGNFLIKTLYRHNVRIDMRMKRASNALTSLGAEKWLRVSVRARPRPIARDRTHQNCPPTHTDCKQCTRCLLRAEARVRRHITTLARQFQGTRRSRLSGGFAAVEVLAIGWPRGSPLVES